MRQLRFELAGGFEREELEEIHAGALRLLEETGIACAHRGVHEALSGTPGISIGGGRIKFARELVERYVAKLRAEGKRARPPERFTLGGPWIAMWLCDPQSNSPREATAEDCARMVKLCDALNLGPGTAPVVASDAPLPLRAIHTDRLCLLHSRELGGGLGVRNEVELELEKEMWAAAGRKFPLVVQFLVSPLKFDETCMDLILRCLGDPQVALYPALAIPMLGATAPLDVAGAAMQAAAEALAAYITLDIISHGALHAFSLRVEPFDFKYGTIVYGSPEFCLLGLLAEQLHQFYCGAPSYLCRLRTCAKVVGPQSCAERMACAVVRGLAGARHFDGVGQLSVDEVFSPVQAILDVEIVRYVERVVQGMPGGEARAGLEAVQRVGPAGQFLDDELTLGRYAEMFWQPELFLHWNIGQWMRHGRPDILREAAARAERIIAEHTFELPEQARRAVDKVYKKAQQLLCS